MPTNGHFAGFALKDKFGFFQKITFLMKQSVGVLMQLKDGIFLKHLKQRNTTYLTL